MEEGKEPLLSPTTPRDGGWSPVNSLKSDFLTRLPDKVRSTIDVESSSMSLTLPSKSSASLTQGEKEYCERPFATLKSFKEVDANLVSSDGINTNLTTDICTL